MYARIVFRATLDNGLFQVILGKTEETLSQQTVVILERNLVFMSIEMK